MTPEQTDVRSREIALAKYIDFGVSRSTNLRYAKWTAFIGIEPTGATLNDPSCKLNMQQAIEQLAPRFATDGSLLSTLMKGLAGKGHGPKVVGYTDTYWEARLIDPRNSSVRNLRQRQSQVSPPSLKSRVSCQAFRH